MRPIGRVHTDRMAEIPIIDITGLSSPRPGDRVRVAAEVGRACRGVGFFVIVGHGVPSSVIDDAFAAARAFFALPSDVKETLAIGTHGANRGYVGCGVESLDEHAGPDRKEAYNLIWTDARSATPNLWPPLPHWRERATACFDAMLAVGRRLHAAFALDLGLASDFFDRQLDRPMATMRLLRYPPSEAGEPRSGAGTHTDYGNVTLLATDGVGGLQVRARDGEWIAVTPPPDGLVCNIGDCLMRWTNDVYRSTPHRVVDPPRERYSIAFFLDPNPDAQVAAIASCVPPGEAPRYPPIAAADYLAQRFAATYGRGP